MRTLLAAALAAVALLAAPTSADAAPSASCSVQDRSSRPVSKSLPRTYRKATTWVYGDSITWQSRAHLKKTLPGKTAVDAYWGRNTQHAANALLADLRRYKHNPKTVVMAVGTNDMLNIPAFAKQVDRVKRILPRKTRLVWVDTYSDTNPDYNLVNRVIRSKVKTAYWAPKNAPVGKSPLLMDGLHVNDQGCEVRNNLIRKAVVR